MYANTAVSFGSGFGQGAGSAASFLEHPNDDTPQTRALILIDLQRPTNKRTANDEFASGLPSSKH